MFFYIAFLHFFAIDFYLMFFLYELDVFHAKCEKRCLSWIVKKKMVVLVFFSFLSFFNVLLNFKVFIERTIISWVLLNVSKFRLLFRAIFIVGNDLFWQRKLVTVIIIIWIWEKIKSKLDKRGRTLKFPSGIELILQVVKAGE